ncbi:porin [Ochrobactrum intermedium]|uniref:porin n=1 Tax=Brucella intermedia TaxID=94625 RepID=UPI00159C377D|nr:porin [Brucella intermedia]NVM41806.1 porin [Brucella intermedia]
MNIKSLLLGSAAALVAASGAQAADAIVAPEPEAVEYVRVCDAYGAGYFYIPGTETCLRIHGYVRYDATGGDNVYGRGFADRNGDVDTDRDTWSKLARFALRVSTASETELGTLKTYSEMRFQWADGADSSSTGTLRFGYIQLGGLRVGLDESAFVTFPGYLGNVINDDVILAGGYRTGLISYTFTGGNGFSAILSLEQGNTVDVDTGTYRDVNTGAEYTISGKIDDYMPHVVGGLKYAGGWGSIVGVAAYDAYNEEWAGKIRADINVTDQFSVWVMGGYKSNDDTYQYVYTDANGRDRGIRQINSFYGTWGGDWAIWGGAAYKATEKATFNLQLAYDDSETFAATANVAYELVPGFTITPEVSYTKWEDKNSVLKGEDAWQGMVRFQRSF